MSKNNERKAKINKIMQSKIDLKQCNKGMQIPGHFHIQGKRENIKN